MKLVVFGWLSAFLSLSLACTGETASGPGAGPDGDEPGKDGNADGPASTCRVKDEVLVPARVYRLSAQQWVNTVEAATGHRPDPSRLPEDGAETTGYSIFDNVAAALVVQERHVSAYHELALEAAERLVASREKGADCIVSQKPGKDCVDGFLGDVGKKFFRRPLGDDERARFAGYFGVNAQKWGGKTAARLTAAVMMQAPQFIFRTELGDGSVSEGRIRMTDHEVASALSYGLTDRPPDELLLEAASAGKLGDRGELRAQARRLLDGKDGRTKLADFFQQLVGVKDIATVARDKAVFPDFVEGITKSMADETSTFVQKVLFDAEGSLTDLFTADYSFVDAKLAKIYGVTGNGFEKVSLPPERMGLLSQPGVLASSSHPAMTSPAMRGVRTMQKFLCMAIPTPPAGAADQASGKIFSNDPKATQREHWDFARANKEASGCVACHAAFWSYGLGFEQFDPIGRHRPTEFGKTIDTSVVLEAGTSADGEYPNTMAMVAKILETREGRECFTMQIGSYVAGREIDPTDGACEVEYLANKLQDSGYRVQDLLLDIVQLDSFRDRWVKP